MKLLAIETSCDDTGIAIIEIKNKKQKIKKINTLSNIVSSQITIHRKWGGVYPDLAKREHQRNLIPVLKKALKKAKLLKKTSKNYTRLNGEYKTLEEILKREKVLFYKLKEFIRFYKKPKIDLIAVTIGPGLEPCLWVGVNFVKALAFAWKLPVIQVNHIEAHIAVDIADKDLKNIFPAISLIVSGGHTQLILMRGLGKYQILGQTRDDAAGECFDKVARILGLSYPGGPAIEAEALKLGKNHKPEINLPRPMIYQGNFDFSFSGLKTAVLYHHKNQSSKAKKKGKYIQEMAAEAQRAIIDVLVSKTIKAAKNYKVKSIILGGGVIANSELRQRFQETIKKEMPSAKYFVPDTKLCTDNALMIAITACLNFSKKKKKNWQDIKARANLRIDEVLC